MCARIWPPTAVQMFDRSQGRPLRNEIYLRAMEDDPDIVALAKKSAKNRARLEARRRDILARWQADMLAAEVRTAVAENAGAAPREPAIEAASDVNDAVLSRVSVNAVAGEYSGASLPDGAVGVATARGDEGSEG